MLPKSLIKIFYEANQLDYSLSELQDLGISSSHLNQYLNDGDFSMEDGIITLNSSYLDQMVYFQRLYGGIYAYRTALFLLNYGTFVPYRYEIRFLDNVPTKIKSEHLIIPYATPSSSYGLGVTEAETFEGHIVYTYDIERTLLDYYPLRNKVCFSYEDLLNDYWHSANRNLEKLENYANKLGQTELLKELKTYG